MAKNCPGGFAFTACPPGKRRVLRRGVRNVMYEECSSQVAAALVRWLRRCRLRLSPGITAVAIIGVNKCCNCSRAGAGQVLQLALTAVAPGRMAAVAPSVLSTVS